MKLEELTQLLSSLGISFVLDGPNTKKGNVNVSCPWCGDDPSHHMGIEPARGVYGCWRDPSHRGRNLAVVLSALAGIPRASAQALIGDANIPEFEESIDRIAAGALLADPTDASTDRTGGVDFLELSPEFRPLNELTMPSAQFLRYLMDRDFGTLLDVLHVARLYELSYAISYRFAYRIIIPVFYEGKLVTWTARSIRDRPKIRYDTLNVEYSVMNIKHTVYNYDRAKAIGGDVLFVVEGPMDCIKLDFAIRSSGMRSVALFNTTPTYQQLSHLSTLDKKFKRVVVMFDAGTRERMQADSLVQELESLGFRGRAFVGLLPPGVKDPGDLTFKGAVKLCSQIRREVLG